ncbi:NAD(P)-binding protein [Nocardia sp. SYP-A9097]|uniref:protoporphyrinogen/coproporphyrinogen oxidase n=1 Tax=Nocardia sp. SYP-A9097 TaxID=2663237 RepID=UPI00129AE634|nr:FAD-dependent oxidoreductase [Nocardia sp. SYP-A9097]MRH92062.1 NAD(P)-binding protein [Nocardia sp. SYP-A9097]
MAKRVAVVGSGISGISAAVRLHRAGAQVDLIESDGMLGGRLGVSRLGGHDVMLGGKNIGRRYHVMRGMLADLGATDFEHFGINTSRVKDGALEPIDSGRRLRALTKIAKLSGLRDFLMLARLAVQVRNDESARLLGSAFGRRLGARYDSKPLSEHFGSGLAHDLIRPVTVRMNGAEPDEVYLGNFGTNLAMLLDTFDQLPAGFQPVLEAVEELVNVRLSTSVRRIAKAGDGISLTVSTPTGGVEVLGYDGVVLATPAHIAADILHEESAQLGRLLRSVNYFPTTVAVVEYAEDIFRSDIRAVAMADGPCSNAGSYGINQRNIVRYTFSGRHGRVISPTAEVIETMVGDAEALLVEYLGIDKPARTDIVTRHWDQAYCAYGPNYAELLEQVHSLIEQIGGNISLAGDYILGASMENCCRSGFEAADALVPAITE